MKIRHGFVSNSSSSSFVILTTVENYKECLNKLNKDEAKTIKENFFQLKRKFLGKTVVVNVEWVDDGTDSYSFDRFIDDENDMIYEVDEIYQKFVNLLGKKKDEFFSHTEEW